MEPIEAAEQVLAEEPGASLHWTVIWDRALRGGLLEPSPDARAALQRALAEAARTGTLERTSTGTYRLADAGPGGSQG